jgi:hypothetical protein
LSSGRPTSPVPRSRYARCSRSHPRSARCRRCHRRPAHRLYYRRALRQRSIHSPFVTSPRCAWRDCSNVRPRLPLRLARLRSCLSHCATTTTRRRSPVALRRRSADFLLVPALHFAPDSHSVQACQSPWL